VDLARSWMDKSPSPVSVRTFTLGAAGILYSCTMIYVPVPEREPRFSAAFHCDTRFDRDTRGELGALVLRAKIYSTGD
jgi:hypothetical protein